MEQLEIEERANDSFRQKLKELEDELMSAGSAVEKYRDERDDLKQQCHHMSSLLKERNDQLMGIEKEVSKIKCNFSKKEEKRIMEYEHMIGQKNKSIEELSAKLQVILSTFFFGMTCCSTNDGSIRRKLTVMYRGIENAKP